MSRASGKAFDPGMLNLRMQVLEPVVSDDGLGGGAVGYVVRRSLWAAFDPQTPSVSAYDPVRDALARGTVRTHIGTAPPVGWRLSWNHGGTSRTVQVEALERGTAADPFDMCKVHEVSP